MLNHSKYSVFKRMLGQTSMMIKNINKVADKHQTWPKGPKLQQHKPVKTGKLQSQVNQNTDQIHLMDIFLSGLLHIYALHD